MNKKLILTSFVALGFAIPAFADTTTAHTETTFSEPMQEDTTYTGAATYDNTGVYEGSVTANAEYEDISYSVRAGLYLTGIDSGNAATTATCTAGNFCPGVQSTTYTNNAFGNTGLQSCSTATNGDYTLSATGASANTDCYRTCTTSDVAHSRGTVNGGYYYGDNNQCEPTDCVDGWHVKPAVPDLISMFRTGSASVFGFVNNAGQAQDQATALGISDKNTWAVDYGSSRGMLIGQARCSTRGVQNPWQRQSGYTFDSEHFVSSLSDETGQTGAKYCYCNVTGYKDTNGNMQSLSSAWVFNDDLIDASTCASGCANNCANSMGLGLSEYLPLRAAVLGAVLPSPAMCEANTININWTGATTEAINANNAGSTVYEGDIRTPSEAIPVTGKRFIGWRFVKPSND